ncbi:MAG TPA: hypothetical protein VMQ17_01745 [Candidatus Sulfotelmatobacter sp.]|jgi:hypothetical protein|nr:hypothetical protein [Candidatus Sulfotelmatobacter sp.]
MRLSISPRMIPLAALLFSAAAFAQVSAVAPYTVSTFATSVPGVYTQPDSIAVLDGHVFIGFGNGAAPDGSDGKSSTIVEYDRNGNVITTYSVKGHNDGLKVNPLTHHLWSMQNEDGNPNLVIIDPKAHTQKVYTFGPTPHGGGYDDIAFRGHDVFVSASNPLHNPNAFPAVVRAELHGTMVNVSPVLMGTATATDIPTDTPVGLNLQDPDSMTFDPFGDLVLDSQADSELIIVHHAGAFDQSVYHLALTLDGSPVQIDDTVFATTSHGVILVSDRDGETIYTVSKDIFAPGHAYSATPTSVGRVNLDTGVITNVVTGMVSPHGMAFIRDDRAQGD